MVARTPPKQQRKMAVVAPQLPSPTLLRETVKKVDKCMARLQELQNTVTSGANLRCKHEPLRIRNANSRRSPPGKLPAAGHWRRMSLPAMLLGETMGEVLQATQFASSIVAAAAATDDDPKTPLRIKQKTISVDNNNSGLTMQARRRREKQLALRSDNTRSLQRGAKSKINFKLSSPPQNRECNQYIANRVSPRNKPWSRKTVLFPNPLFHSSSPTSQQPPVIARNRQTPHRFLIKSKSPPRTDSSKFHVKIKSPPLSISPPRAPSSIRRSFSPSRLANRLISPLKNRKSVQKRNEEIIIINKFTKSYKFLIKSPPGKFKSSLVSISPNRTTSFGNKKLSPKAAPKLGRSFSPSRLANRIASPLKTRNYMKGPTKIISGNKRPTYWSSQSSPLRI